MQAPSAMTPMSTRSARALWPEVKPATPRYVYRRPPFLLPELQERPAVRGTVHTRIEEAGHNGRNHVCSVRYMFDTERELKLQSYLTLYM